MFQALRMSQSGARKLFYNDFNINLTEFELNSTN